MLLVFVLTVLAATATAERMTFRDGRMPIKVIDFTLGQGKHKRVTHLEATILPKHVRNKGRVNFPTRGSVNKYFKEAKADGDERGHLVGSQFSGPPTWYNLSPQNARVNRNKDYQSLTTDWYNSECEVRKFLDKKGKREVRWTVDMVYVRDSNRPDRYHLRVEFLNNGKVARGGIDAWIKNPFKKQDSTFWVCRSCRRDNGHNANCKRA